MRRSSDKRKVFLRVFSVVFSLFIWLYVISSAQVEVEKLVPLSIELPEGAATATVLKKELAFMVKGPRVFVRTLLDQEKKIEIKLKDYYKSGQNSYSLSLSRYQLTLPLGVKLVGFEPKKLDFKLEKKITRTVPVTLNYDPEVTKMYEIQNTVLDPSSVTISGANSIVRKIKNINTSLVDSKLFSDGKAINVELVSPHENLILAQKNTTVHYTMASKLTEFTFTSIPIIFHSTKLIKSSLPKRVSITLKGEKDFIKKLDKDLIKVVAQIPSSASGKVSVTLETELPDELELMNLEPESVTVNLEQE